MECVAWLGGGIHVSGTRWRVDPACEKGAAVTGSAVFAFCKRLRRKADTPTGTPSENNSPMAKSTANEYGVKEKRATKGGKARRNFELNGTYSQKHLRLKEEQALRVGSTGRDQPSTKQDKNKKAAKT